MKKTLIILVFQLLFCWSLTAQNNFAEKPLSQAEKAAISTLKDHVLNKRKELIAEHIKFPLYRDKYFNYVIKDKKGFLEIFDRIFDEKQIENFFHAGWEYYYSVTTESHELLADYGSYYGEITPEGNLLLTSITLSESEKQYLKTLVEKDKKLLHESLRGHENPECIIFAGKYRIRIDEMPDGKLRYASWSKDKPISSAPDIVLHNGEMSGTRWWTSYTFKNGEFTYTFEDSILGGLTFVVEKNDKTILCITQNISVRYFRRY